MKQNNIDVMKRLANLLEVNVIFLRNDLTRLLQLILRIWLSKTKLLVADAVHFKGLFQTS